ncbi:V-set and transmembrane domain-containing protein 1-like isoform X2 [Apodemus sylvaticus]|uniref:V-set and transmembrane domain-containing protein 1-like isoform X2 n=1 Tax=Apodemus sylvaticus TaxID=10129 RepID=UPI002242A903|nr:V-set and transmembrane domain-containing protein 1-like isoform X2 [Apodemus sylvaticus]
MDTDFIYLLCLGLCLCYGDEDEHEELPRPSISAWPSSVVKCKSNVTLRCRTHFQNVTVTLGRLHNSQYQLQTSSLGKEAEFHLTNLQLEDAGGYFCTYRTAFSHSWSGQSRHLQLAVTDGVGGGGGNCHRPSDSKLILLTTFRCLCISLLFVSIFFIYRCTRQDRRKRTKWERKRRSRRRRRRRRRRRKTL